MEFSFPAACAIAQPAGYEPEITQEFHVALDEPTSVHWAKLLKWGTALKTASEIAAHPKFIQLRRTRRRLAWGMAVLSFVVYAGFVLIMAYGPNWLGQPIDPAHATTIGLPIGAGVIVFIFAMTGIYTWAANKYLEPLAAALRKELSE